MSDKNKRPAKQWIVICYGNILRSQVLEQYLRYYAEKYELNIEFSSAGIANQDEFPNTNILLEEIRQELHKRGIPCALNRNTWDNVVEAKIESADIVICADSSVKATVLKRMNSRIDKEKVFTFYGMISEGEIDFEDTYDYEKKRQDPIRFKNAFDELDRIAGRILSQPKISL